MGPEGYGEDGWRRTKRITTLDELLIAMTPDHWALMGELKLNRNLARATEAYLTIYQDRNYYTDATRYEVDLKVAQTAISRGLVCGIPKWGYTSDWEYKVSDEGHRAANEIHRRLRDAEKTASMKAIEDRDPGDE